MPKKSIVGPAPRRVTVAPIPTRPPTGPDHEEVVRLAYSFWEARGCTGGSPEEDWYRAESELRACRATGSARFHPEEPTLAGNSLVPGPVRLETAKPRVGPLHPKRATVAECRGTC
jgi:hypothetical protein